MAAMRSGLPDGRFRVVMTPPLDLAARCARADRRRKGRTSLSTAWSSSGSGHYPEQWLLAPRPLALRPERPGEGRRQGLTAPEASPGSSIAPRLVPRSPDVHGPRSHRRRRSTGGSRKRAAAIQRGVGRLLRARGFAIVCELPLATGRRADVVGLGPAGDLWIVEIKSSIEDFRVDRKWPEYRFSCDRLFFATHAEVPAAIFLEDAGLILADAYGADSSAMRRSTGWPRRRGRRCWSASPSAAAHRLHGLVDLQAGEPGW